MQFILANQNELESSQPITWTRFDFPYVNVPALFTNYLIPVLRGHFISVAEVFDPLLKRLLILINCYSHFEGKVLTYSMHICTLAHYTVIYQIRELMGSDSRPRTYKLSYY